MAPPKKKCKKGAGDNDEEAAMSRRTTFATKIGAKTAAVAASSGWRFYIRTVAGMWR